MIKGMSFLRSDLGQDRAEARLAAESVERRIDVRDCQAVVALLVGCLQPRKRSGLVAQRRIDPDQPCSCKVLALRPRFERVNKCASIRLPARSYVRNRQRSLHSRLYVRPTTCWFEGGDSVVRSSHLKVRKCEPLR